MSPCSCGPAPKSDTIEGDQSAQGMDGSSASYIEGLLATPAGTAPRVATELTSCDRWGEIKMRWGIGRDSYIVPPGLYAVGSPDPESRVIVTANYKLSFDQTRETLAGRDAWILVLDTKGINVWCAAGKGTFGTEELVRRVKEAKLDQVVTHRRLILPQLGAPGVAAHLVKEQCGFRVTWGPVMLEDLPAFLDTRLKATPEMRRKAFPLRERAILIPVEIVAAWKLALLLMLAFFLASGLGAPAGYWAGLLGSGVTAVTALLLALLSGAALVPLLLPWIPGRAFALKGMLVGAAVVTAHMLLQVGFPGDVGQGLEFAAWLLMVPALSSFVAMNFTGASTFTSLSGVRREMAIAVPLQLCAVVAGLGFWIGARIAA